MTDSLIAKGQTLPDRNTGSDGTILVQAGSGSEPVTGEDKNMDDKKPVITLSADTETVVLQTTLTATATRCSWMISIPHRRVNSD